MPTPVVELIALEIVRRLEAITIENDYTFSVCSVVRPNRLGEGYSPEDKMIVLTQGDSVRNDDLSHPGNPPAIAYDVKFEIECIVRTSDFDPDEYNPEQSERGSQIIKALRDEATDTGTWHTMDGNAVLADIGDVKQFPVSAGDHNGVTVDLNIIYRTSENDPYTVRA